MYKNTCYKGRQQAEATGKRLQELGFSYTSLIHSTMTRAQETAKIIESFLKNITIKSDSLLNEGSPIQPEPPSSNWKAEINVRIIIYMNLKFLYMYFL